MIFRRLVSKYIILSYALFCVQILFSQKTLASKNNFSTNNTNSKNFLKLTLSNPESKFFLGIFLLSLSSYSYHNQKANISKASLNKQILDSDGYYSHMNSYESAKNISDISLGLSVITMSYGILSGAFFERTNLPRMMRSYNYFDISKDDALVISRNILLSLGYKIDIYAPESHFITTKSIRVGRVLRKYDYVIYLQVSDRIEIHLSAARNIFNRGSESSLGGKEMVIKQVETYMPNSIQKKIFDPITEKLLENTFKKFEQIK